MRILFVGDEASLPAELSEFIADLGEEWHTTTVVDGHAAMAAVAASSLDAVIALFTRERVLQRLQMAHNFGL